MSVLPRHYSRRSRNIIINDALCQGLDNLYLLIIRFLNLEKVSVLPHPSYFSYLDPCDCFLFPKRKNISGRRYRYQKALGSDVSQCLSSLPKSGYRDAFQIWIHILKLYILNSEEYLKGILMFILLLQTSSFLRTASIEISYSST